jgi:hypothetical protein
LTLIFIIVQDFLIIYSITNYDTVEENEDLLFNLIDENTANYDYKELKLPFTKAQLLNAVLTNNTSSLFIDSIQDLDEVDESQSLKRKRNEPTENNENVSPYAKSIQNLDEDVEMTYEKTDDVLSPENVIKRQKLEQSTGLSNKNKRSNPYDDSDNINNKTRRMVFGGSIKNKRKQINKTKNNKRKNKRATIKKRNAKNKRYTRRR